MVAAAGVTTCLDMSGTSDDLARIAKTNGAAINYGTLEAILPGKNVPTNDLQPKKSLLSSIRR